MKIIAIILAATLSIAVAEPPKKPAPKPPAKPAAKPKAKPKRPRAAPVKSIGELALEEAKKADENKDGKITGTEVTVLRTSFSSNPKSWLSVYDDNANRQLDDTEIADIKWGPALAPAKAPAPKKK